MNSPESPLSRTRRLSARIRATIRAIEALHPEQPEHRGIIVDIHAPIERIRQAAEALQHDMPSATSSAAQSVARHAYL